MGSRQAGPCIELLVASMSDLCLGRLEEAAAARNKLLAALSRFQGSPSFALLVKLP